MMRRVPRLHFGMDLAARQRFQEWGDAAAVSQLLSVLEDRQWRDSSQSGYGYFQQPIYRDVTGEDLVWLKAEVIRRIEAAGGRVAVGGVVATVASGELRISMG